jgi:sialic acid synthase SpsE
MFAIESLRSHFNLPVGYSDHTEGQLMPIAAAALGARVIEKHFTIDRSLPGPDQNMSMEPADFKEMVQSIRQVELSLGNGDKVPQQGEVANIGIARQRIIATRGIKRDAIIMPEDITTSRCANGIFADKFWDIPGSSAKADFKAGEAIEL